MNDTAAVLPDAMPAPAAESCPTDGEIVALFFARDERALEESRAKYGGWCLAAAQNILGSREDAEECVNDALFRAWNAIPPERPAYLGAFLAQIARRLALDRYRAETAEKRGGNEIRLCVDELEEAVGAGGEWEPEKRNDLREALDRWLRLQTPEARRIFLARYWYAFSLRDTAKLCGVSVGAVKMSLARSRKRLKIFLEKEGFEV